jgi:DNA-binding response OmpR family regulator
MNTTPTSSRVPAHRILVATPQSDVAMLLLGWFAKQGLYVGLVADARELADAAKLPQAPECLILDDALGAATLSSVVKVVRSQAGWKKTVIVATGSFSEEQEVELLRAGADDVVAKPLRLTALMLRMVRFLEARHAQ